MYLIRNQAYLHGYRGFESLSLRFTRHSPKGVGGFFISQSASFRLWLKDALLLGWRGCSYVGSPPTPCGLRRARATAGKIKAKASKYFLLPYRSFSINILAWSFFALGKAPSTTSSRIALRRSFCVAPAAYKLNASFHFGSLE